MNILSLFARSFGLFSLSPLFRSIALPGVMRFALTLVTTFLIASPRWQELATPSSPFILLEMGKELVIGYLIGFIFSLALEALSFAGDVIGVMGSFSLTELFTLEGNKTLVLSHFFLLMGAFFFFSFDLHHLLLRTLYGEFALSFDLSPLLQATSSLFTTAMNYLLFPFASLLLIVLILALASRLFSSFPILWIGLPIQLLITLIILTCTLPLFPKIFEKSILQMHEFIHRLLVL